MTSEADSQTINTNHVYANTSERRPLVNTFIDDNTLHNSTQPGYYGATSHVTLTRDITQPIRTQQPGPITDGNNGNNVRGSLSPRAQSVPIISVSPAPSMTRDDDEIFEDTGAQSDAEYGYMPGMNVEITQSDNDMAAPNLPEGLRHVMLHVIGSRPSEEVKFRRMKYRLEAGDNDTTFLPRGRKIQRRPSTNKRGTYRRQHSLNLRPEGERERLESSQSAPGPLPALISRQQSRESQSNPPADPVERTDVIIPDSLVLRGSSGRQKGVLIVLAINDLMASMSLSILAPFFPMEARNQGLSDAISGWVFGVFALVQCLASPVFGRVLPRIGAKFLSQSGQFFAGGCTILFGMLQYVSAEDNGLLFITYCFALRMFMAVGCAANGTAAFAIAARTFPDNPATIFGLLETAVGFGLMMGPALGGVLYEVGGFVMPFAVIGTAMVLSVPVGICVLPSDVIEEKRDRTADSSVSDFLRIPAVSLTAVAAFIACLAWVMPDPTLEPHLSQFNLSPTVIGMVFLLMSACYAICSPVWGWVADNVPDSSPMMVVGFTGTGIGFLILGPSPLFRLPADFTPLWLNVVGLIVIGLMVSLALVPTYDKILDAAEKAGIDDTLANCSTVAGIWNSAYCFGEFVGPVVAGWMAGKVGFPWTMSLASGLCFLMAIAMLVLYIYESKFGPTGVKPDAPKLMNDNSEADERTPLLNHLQASS